ncbi:MAG: glycosyltransferase family 39 protein [Chloroflexota bacterium]
MTWFFGNRKSLIVILISVFLLAGAVRFYDLTDLPLDFAPTRQLFSALKARGMYYDSLPASSSIPEWQREMAVRQWKSIQEIEPPVIENLTAFTYRFTGEYLWIARVYSSLFWVFSGIAIFLAAQEMIGTNGAVISLLFYLFLPYGVIASRTFQPDPLMVSLISSAIWANFHWANHRDDKNGKPWLRAASAGILTGLAIFVKNVSVFPLAMGLIALVIEQHLHNIPENIKDSRAVKFWLTAGKFLSNVIKDTQVWAVAGLSILPSALYIIYGLFVSGFLGQQFAFRFFPQLWPDPGFYLRWLGMIEGVIGFGTLAAGILGLFLVKGRVKALLNGLWLGYFIYGMTFAYHITTHDYYQLLLIPIAAVSLAPMADYFFETIETRITAGKSKKFTKIILAGLVILVVSIQVWNVRVTLYRNDWRKDEKFWVSLGEKLGNNGPVLTVAQDYGYRLAYWGWQEVDSWYDSGDLELRYLDGRNIDLMKRFKEQSAGKHYLVVTQLSKLANQKEIKNYIYQTFPVFAQGKGYIIFDLTKTK